MSHGFVPPVCPTTQSWRFIPVQSPEMGLEQLFWAGMKGWSTGKLGRALNHGFDHVNLTRVIRPVLTLSDSGLILKQLSVKEDDKSSTGSFVCIDFIFQMLKLTLFPKTSISLPLAWWKMRFRVGTVRFTNGGKKCFSWCLRVTVNGWSWGNPRNGILWSRFIRALMHMLKFKLWTVSLKSNHVPKYFAGSRAEYANEGKQIDLQLMKRALLSESRSDGGWLFTHLARVLPGWKQHGQQVARVWTCKTHPWNSTAANFRRLGLETREEAIFLCSQGRGTLLQRWFRAQARVRCCDSFPSRVCLSLPTIQEAA